MIWNILPEIHPLILKRHWQLISYFILMSMVIIREMDASRNQRSTDFPIQEKSKMIMVSILIGVPNILLGLFLIEMGAI